MNRQGKYFGFRAIYDDPQCSWGTLDSMEWCHKLVCVLDSIMVLGKRDSLRLRPSLSKQRFRANHYEHVVMDIFGAIRGVIEIGESSEPDGPEEAGRLERAIQLSLQPPERPIFRPLYDSPPLASLDLRRRQCRSHSRPLRPYRPRRCT